MRNARIHVTNDFVKFHQREVYKCQRGNQKPQIENDRQCNGQKKKDKQ